jgi:hypothetical protein
LTVEGLGGDADEAVDIVEDQSPLAAVLVIAQLRAPQDAQLLDHREKRWCRHRHAIVLERNDPALERVALVRLGVVQASFRLWISVVMLAQVRAQPV